MVSLRTCTESRRCSGGSRRCWPTEIHGQMWCRQAPRGWSCSGWDRRRTRVVWQRHGCAPGAVLLRRNWLREVSEPLLGPSGIYLAAPAERFCNAQQGALMLREGPRLSAVGCETGDWSHVDVYLTKTLDYRLLVLAGSSSDAGLLTWTSDRGSTVVAVGEDVDSAGLSLRYRHDDEDDVRLLTETLVAELVAQHWWATA